MHSSPNTVGVKIHCFVCQVQHRKKEERGSAEAAKIFFVFKLENNEIQHISVRIEKNKALEELPSTACEYETLQYSTIITVQYGIPFIFRSAVSA